MSMPPPQRPPTPPKTELPPFDKVFTWAELGKRAEGKGNDFFISEIDKNLAFAKQQVTSGKLKLTEYQTMIEDIVPKAKQHVAAMGGNYQSAALQGVLINSGVIEPSTGAVKLGFTKQEYAKLPESVLPTQKDVKEGVFDETYAPFKRYPTTTDTGTTEPIDTTITPGGGEKVGDYTGPKIEDPYGAAITTDARQKQIEEEALRQRAQQEQQTTYQKTERAKLLEELGGLLSQRTTEQMSLETPGMLEDLNTRGLLRSSQLGQSLSQRRGEFERGNQMALSQTALGYGEQNIADTASILARQQGFQTAGLQARLGLEDAASQEQLAITLAELSKPASPQGKSSGEKWAQGITAVGAINPYKVKVG